MASGIKPVVFLEINFQVNCIKILIDYLMPTLAKSGWYSSKNDRYVVG